MSKIKVAINGYGVTGHSFVAQALEEFAKEALVGAGLNQNSST